MDYYHGTERALAELLDRLAHRYGCEVHLYSERVNQLVLDEPGVGRADRTDRKGAIFWHKVPSIPGPHLLKFLAWMTLNSVARWRDRFFRRISFDLVLSPGINCLTADVIIVHALFHRLVALSREEIAGASLSVGLIRRLHRRAYYSLLVALERRIYSNRKTWLATVSQRTSNFLAHYFQRTDVRIIPNGVDTTQFSVSTRSANRSEARNRRGFSDSDFVLLLIGNDWRVKGLAAILAAMAATPTLPLQLVVAGDDAPKPFQAMAEQLGLAHRCHWEAPRCDVIDLYAAADLYVSPTYEDSFGLPVAEAMACGLPAITSSLAGVSALIRNNENGFILADPEDTQALALLFKTIHADKGLRDRVSQAAAAAAKDWTWDRNAAETWKLLGAAAENKEKSHRG